MTNIVEQIVSAIEASGKVVTSVCVAGVAVLLIDWSYQDFFSSLPPTIIPFIRLVVVVTAVLSFAALWGSISPSLVSFAAYMLRPLRRRAILAKLRNLDIYEVLLLSKSRAKFERNVQIGPDTSVAISLVEKGLIKIDAYSALLTRHEAHENYKIPMEVWKILIEMPEFKMEAPQRLTQLLDSYGPSETDIVAALPQQHPAVITERETEGT